MPANLLPEEVPLICLIRLRVRLPRTFNAWSHEILRLRGDFEHPVLTHPHAASTSYNIYIVCRPISSESLFFSCEPHPHHYSISPSCIVARYPSFPSFLSLICSPCPYHRSCPSLVSISVSCPVSGLSVHITLSACMRG